MLNHKILTLGALAVALGVGCLGDGSDQDGEPQAMDVDIDREAIVGGYDANTSENPWMVAVYSRGNFAYGGVLISSRWVLTTAHGVWWDPPEVIEVVAGDTDLTAYTPWRQTRGVDDYILHPDFDGFYHDLALLYLDSAFDITSPKVGTAQMATPDDLAEGVTDYGVYGSVTGWGDMWDGGPNSLEHLLEVDVPIMSEHHDDFIGAGFPDGGYDSCHGDSGGPFLVPNAAGTGALIAGLVAWNPFGCAAPGSRTYHTRVSTYHNWIKEQMGCDPNPGDLDYCLSICPCGAGKGDCDYDYHCAEGLECVHNVGADYGYGSAIDVCLPVCPDVPLGHYSYCQQQCPCGLGEGNCTGNGDCLPGLVCVPNVGDDHGLDPWDDVCERPCSDGPMGSINYCHDDCPCGWGEGDCGNDDDCATDLSCVHNVGDDYGFAFWVDVCL